MPWIVEEATKRAMEHFKNHDTIEMVIRNAKKAYTPYENVKMKWVEEVKEKTVDQNTIRNLVRNLNKNNTKLDQIIPRLDQIFTPLQNVQILSIMNTALSAANLVATVAGMVIICNKLNNIDRKLDEIQREIKVLQKTVEDNKKIDVEMQINKPCRKLVDDYKMLTPALSKGKPVPEEKLIGLIQECKDYIISLNNLRDSLPLDAILNLMFTLLPIMSNCIMVYYQRFYDPNLEKHPLHDSCMYVFDLLSAPDFIEQIQDYMFLEKHLSNRQVNEYLDCHRLILYTYRTKIEQLLDDLKTCGNKENYEDAMLWTRQYVAQQARAVQAELESKVGPEQAKVLMEQAMQEASII